MPDLFFYRDPESDEKTEDEEKADGVDQVGEGAVETGIQQTGADGWGAAPVGGDGAAVPDTNWNADGGADWAAASSAPPPENTQW